jgi:hypothetical protein
MQNQKVLTPNYSYFIYFPESRAKQKLIHRELLSSQPYKHPLGAAADM